MFELGGLSLGLILEELIYCRKSIKKKSIKPVLRPWHYVKFSIPPRLSEIQQIFQNFLSYNKPVIKYS